MIIFLGPAPVQGAAGSPESLNGQAVDAPADTPAP